MRRVGGREEALRQQHLDGSTFLPKESQAEEGTAVRLVRFSPLLH